MNNDELFPNEIVDEVINKIADALDYKIVHLNFFQPFEAIFKQLPTKGIYINLDLKEVSSISNTESVEEVGLMWGIPIFMGDDKTIEEKESVKDKLADTFKFGPFNPLTGKGSKNLFVVVPEKMDEEQLLLHYPCFDTFKEAQKYLDDNYSWDDWIIKVIWDHFKPSYKKDEWNQTISDDIVIKSMVVSEFNNGKQIGRGAMSVTLFYKGQACLVERYSLSTTKEKMIEYTMNKFNTIKDAVDQYPERKLICLKDTGRYVKGDIVELNSVLDYARFEMRISGIKMLTNFKDFVQDEEN